MYWIVFKSAIGEYLCHSLGEDQRIWRACTDQLRGNDDALKSGWNSVLGDNAWLNSLGISRWQMDPGGGTPPWHGKL
jgi:hypothetical protein